MSTTMRHRVTRPVTLRIDGAEIAADLTRPDDARALVVLAHSSGSSRGSARTRELAGILNDGALATLVCDLLTTEEEVLNEITGEFRFDARLMAGRLRFVVDWCGHEPELRGLPIGILGAGTGAAAAVLTAAARHHTVHALVLRGGRLDLAWSDLGRVVAPTLLVAGEFDTPVRAGYELALPRLGSRRRELLVVPRAGHLFVEPGTFAQLGEHAARWFDEHLGVDCDAPPDWRSEPC